MARAPPRKHRTPAFSRLFKYSDAPANRRRRAGRARHVYAGGFRPSNERNDRRHCGAHRRGVPSFNNIIRRQTIFTQIVVRQINPALPRMMRQRPEQTRHAPKSTRRRRIGLQNRFPRRSTRPSRRAVPTSRTHTPSMLRYLPVGRLQGRTGAHLSFSETVLRQIECIDCPGDL